MKKTIIRSYSIIAIIAAALIDTSCIFDAPGDKFYRTLWESEEVPLGPFPVEELTIEFMCENGIKLKTDYSTIVCYGTYESNDQNAIFHDLTLEIDKHLLTFIDAQLSGSTLFLRWRIEDSVYPFTTAMHRPSAYE